jgi:hypothetical protein
MADCLALYLDFRRRPLAPSLPLSRHSPARSLSLAPSPCFDLCLDVRRHRLSTFAGAASSTELMNTTITKSSAALSRGALVGWLDKCRLRQSVIGGSLPRCVDCHLRCCSMDPITCGRHRWLSLALTGLYTGCSNATLMRRSRTNSKHLWMSVNIRAALYRSPLLLASPPSRKCPPTRFTLACRPPPTVYQAWYCAIFLSLDDESGECQMLNYYYSRTDESDAYPCQHYSKS